jgi:hypothetical protein
MTGYSKRSLLEKLGIKEGFKIFLADPPHNYDATLGQLPKNVAVAGRLDGPLDLIQCFVKRRRDLEGRIPALKRRLRPNGMLWISWPKGSSGIKTDLNENIVREIGLKNGLVDVKVCAVDDNWSGLKFVYRLKDRP